MKLWIVRMTGILFAASIVIMSACSGHTNNSPVSTTTNYFPTSTATSPPAPTVTPIPTPTPTPKPIYYYSVYYTVSCIGGGVGGCPTSGAADYFNSSGNVINNTNAPIPFTSPTMTFKSGDYLYVFGSFNGTVLVNIYVNGYLAQTNSGVSSAVATETLN